MCRLQQECDGVDRACKYSAYFKAVMSGRKVKVRKSPTVGLKLPLIKSDCGA